MTRRALSCVALLAALLACRQPQTTEVTYDVTNQKLVATPAGDDSQATKQRKKITQTDGRVQVYMGIGDTIATSLTNLPPNNHAFFTRVDLPREQVQMPSSWPLSTGKAGPQESVKPEVSVDPAALVSDAKKAAPSAGDPEKQQTLENAIQDDHQDSQDEMKAVPPASRPAADKVVPRKTTSPVTARPDPALIAQRRLIAAMLREALALSENANSHDAFNRLKEAEAQVQRLPEGDALRPRLFRTVIEYEVRLLAGDEEKNLIHHDTAAKYLDEASKAIAAGQADKAKYSLDEAKSAVDQFGTKSNSKAELITRIAQYQKQLTPPIANGKAILPSFTYSGQDFDVRVEVAPDGATASGDDKTERAVITKGFYIHGRRDRDWMLFTSTGLALSRLVDDEYGIRETGNTKTLVKLGSDKARGEFLVFLNFQNRGITGQAIPLLFGLGVGSTGSDMRYYLGPGVSLGNWGALHVGLVGGKVQRLRETVDTSDYKGTDPSAERHSVFQTDYFLSITARF